LDPIKLSIEEASMPPILVTQPTATQNSSSPPSAVDETIATHCTYPWRDGQAEWASVDGKTARGHHPCTSILMPFFIQLYGHLAASVLLINSPYFILLLQILVLLTRLDIA